MEPTHTLDFYYFRDVSRVISFTRPPSPLFLIFSPSRIISGEGGLGTRLAIQIIAYFDEVELCNPLGSNTKIHMHKLGCIFFSIGNIHPQFRSILKNIFVVSVASKHGMNCFLRGLGIATPCAPLQCQKTTDRCHLITTSTHEIHNDFLLRAIIMNSPGEARESYHLREHGKSKAKIRMERGLGQEMGTLQLQS